MTQRVFLWTAPRCVSTAFERSMMEIEKSKTFHEPYKKAYYLGPERISPRYKQQSPDDTSTYKNITEMLLEEYDGINLIFCKDMAYYVADRFPNLLDDGLWNFNHTFLIRNPRKSLPSLFKASVNKQLTGWNYFDAQESGFKELYKLYSFLKQQLGKEPVVIDADDLLANPEKVMQAYCQAIGINFDKKILEWEPGPIPDWNAGVGWHEVVMKSSGFKKQDLMKSDINETKNHEEDVPNCIRQIIEENRPYYYELYKSRLTIDMCY